MSERISDESLAILIDLYQLPDDGFEYEGTVLHALRELQERRAADAEQARSAEEAWDKVPYSYPGWASTEIAFKDGFAAGYAARKSKGE